MSDDLYYVRRGEKISGPYSREQLVRFAADGQLQRADAVRRQGQSKWLAAESIAGLFIPTNKAPSPPKAKPPVSSPAPAPTTSPGVSINQNVARDRSKRRTFGAWWKYLFGSSLSIAGITIAAFALLINRRIVAPFFYENDMLTGGGVLLCILLLLMVLAGAALSLAELIRKRSRPIDTRMAVFSVFAFLLCAGNLLLIALQLIIAGPFSTAQVDGENASEVEPLQLPDQLNMAVIEGYARSGDIGRLKRLLAENRPVLSMHHAKNVPVTQALRADRFSGRDLVAAAAQRDQWEAVQLLVDFGKQQDIPQLNVSPAYAFVETADEIRELLRRFPDDAIPPNTLSGAIGRGDTASAELLLKHHLSPRKLDFDVAIRRRSAKCFRLLATHNNAQVNVRRILQKAKQDAQYSGDREAVQFVTQLIAEHKKQ